MIIGDPIIVDVANYDYFSGPYSVTPGLSEQILPTAGTVMLSNLTIAPGEHDPYEGDYEIYPAVTEQIIPVAGTVMMSDITVKGYLDDGEYASVIGRTVEEFLDLNKQVPLVGEYAFYKCNHLYKAVFPVASAIGPHAFDGCTVLRRTSAPEAKLIDEYAFQNCSQLASAEFPKVENIRSYTFANCSALSAAAFASRASFVCAPYGSKPLSDGLARTRNSVVGIRITAQQIPSTT